MKREKNSKNAEGRIGQSYQSHTSSKNAIIKRIVVLVIILSTTLTISTLVLNSRLTRQELMYIQAGEVAIIGYFFLEVS